jgi:hypothetical protein
VLLNLYSLLQPSVMQTTHKKKVAAPGAQGDHLRLARRAAAEFNASKVPMQKLSKACGLIAKQQKTRNSQCRRREDAKQRRLLHQIQNFSSHTYNLTRQPTEHPIQNLKIILTNEQMTAEIFYMHISLFAAGLLISGQNFQA